MVPPLLASLGNAQGCHLLSQMFHKIKKLFSHTIIYGLGNSGNRLVGFFLLPIYSRYLTPEDYGVLALVSMFGEILFILTNMGQNTAIFRTYFQHDDPQDRETVITTSLWLILTLSFPIGLLALLLAKPLGSILTGSPAYTVWLMLGIGGVAFRTLQRMPFAVLRAREESRRYALWSFVRTIVGLVLAIIFVVGLHLGGRGILFSQLLTELLLCLCLLPLTLRGLTFRFSRQDAQDMLGYGLYIVPSAFFSFLLQLSDRYFLKHYTSLHTVGLYSLGYRLGEILSFPMQAFQLAWPQFLFGHHKSPEAPALYARVSTYFVAVIGFLWLAVSLLAEEAVKILAHPSFHEAYHVVPWVSGALLLQGLAYVGGAGINLHRKVKYRPLILAISAAVNVGLNFLLIPRFAMMGAAIATLASYAVQAILRILVSQRLYSVPYEYARLGRLVVVFFTIYNVGSFIVWGSLWHALIGKTCLLLSAPALLYVSGFFEAGEVGRLRGALDNMRQWSRARLQPRSLDQ